MQTDEFITAMDEALAHFQEHGVSHDPKKGLHHVLEYQDLVGHANATELRIVETEFDHDTRGLFHWVNCLTLDQENAMQLLRMTATRLASNEIACMRDTHNKTVHKLQEDVNRITRKYQERVEANAVIVEQRDKSVLQYQTAHDEAQEADADQQDWRNKFEASFRDVIRLKLRFNSELTTAEKEHLESIL